mmetsp:Transcript_1657/g.3301  ORF Transcript_1657/g.3301 Transcript_1657/m.3301 type:complete len:468 (+) Transcript_1657:164-1567(+)
MGGCASKQGAQVSSSSNGACQGGGASPYISVVVKPTTASKRSKRRRSTKGASGIAASIIENYTHNERQQPPSRDHGKNDSHHSSSSSRSIKTATQSSASSMISFSSGSDSIRVADDRRRASRSRNNNNNEQSSSLANSLTSAASSSIQSNQDENNKLLPISSFDQTYKIIKPQTPLGQGNAGQVNQCIHLPTQTACAVKTITKSLVRRKDRIKREIDFLKKVHHPNIIRLHDVFEDETQVQIVMELCRGGELFDRIVEKATEAKAKQAKQKQRTFHPPPVVAPCFPERDAARILHSLLSAVSYLHSHDILHRDIKPENILFSQDSNDDDNDDAPSSSIKLIDFGLSVKHDSRRCPPLTNMVGTSYYMAPEVLAGSYDRSCDLWSVGVVAYVLLSGRPPFNGPTDNVIFQKIKRGRYGMNNDNPLWDSDRGGVSEEAKDFIRRLMDRNPRRRWTADMALEHSWFRMFE